MFLMMSVWRMKGLKEGLIWRSPTVILLVPSCLIYHAASSCLSVWPARFSRPDWAQNKSLNSSYIPPSSPSFHTEYACNISYGFRQCWMLKTLTALRHLPSLPHFLPSSHCCRGCGHLGDGLPLSHHSGWNKQVKLMLRCCFFFILHFTRGILQGHRILHWSLFRRIKAFIYWSNNICSLFVLRCLPHPLLLSHPTMSFLPVDRVMMLLSKI